MPTYFVGVTNVGKSSLINAIAHQLYQVQAPHPLSTKVYYTRTNKATGEERLFFKWQTSKAAHASEMINLPSIRTKETSALMTVSTLPGTTVATTGVRIALQGGSTEETTAIFDTPGMYPHWHSSFPLSLTNLRRLLIRKLRFPRCYVLRQGFSLLLGGIAVVDVMRAACSHILFSVYANKNLGVTAILTERSDAFWHEQLGQKVYPPHSLEELGHLRLTVRKSYMFECYSKHRLRPKADVYVCGVGWVSFNVSAPCDVVLRVRTLPGIVHGVREPLRRNDMLARKRWPRLPRSCRVDEAIPAMNRVIRLVAEEVDESRPAVEQVKREPPLSPGHSSSKPFEAMMQDLREAGSVG